MEPRVNLWIELDSQVVLSRWRVRLLLAIDETGSISSAAEQMRVPYRRAWEKIHEMEQRLGVAFLDTHTGGPRGGGARLTEAARDYIARFQRFSDGIDRYVELAFNEAFSYPAAQKSENTRD